MTEAREMHRRLLTLDTHLDAPVHFARADWSFGDRHDLATDVAQMDLPRMEDGNLSGGFFVIYTEQGPLAADAYAIAHAAMRTRADEIDAMLAAFPNRIGAATTADEVRRLHTEGRLIALRSIENSYFLGADLAGLAEFYARGVRLAGPVHARSNQLADSATDTPLWQGLSPLGRDWVAEMNRLGMVIDASHASDAAFDAMLARSATPLLLSHSGSRTVYDSPRNLDDDRLRALAATGGVICFATIFLSDLKLSLERRELFNLHGRIGELDAAAQRDLAWRWNALETTDPMWQAGFDDYITGLLHVIAVAGIDHVGFGADWDGGGGIPNLADITDYPRVTEALLDHGLSEAELVKLWSGNVLRVLEAAERHAG